MELVIGWLCEDHKAFQNWVKKHDRACSGLVFCNAIYTIEWQVWLFSELFVCAWMVAVIVVHVLGRLCGKIQWQSGQSTIVSATTQRNTIWHGTTRLSTQGGENRKKRFTPKERPRNNEASCFKYYLCDGHNRVATKGMCSWVWQIDKWGKNSNLSCRHTNETWPHNQQQAQHQSQQPMMNRKIYI